MCCQNNRVNNALGCADGDESALATISAPMATTFLSWVSTSNFLMKLHISQLRVTMKILKEIYLIVF
jgi:hypothetical protein